MLNLLAYKAFELKFHSIYNIFDLASSVVSKSENKSRLFFEKKKL
jgi:hypothetical protein